MQDVHHPHCHKVTKTHRVYQLSQSHSIRALISDLLTPLFPQIPGFSHKAAGSSFEMTDVLKFQFGFTTKAFLIERYRKRRGGRVLLPFKCPFNHWVITGLANHGGNSPIPGWGEKEAVTVTNSEAHLSLRSYNSVFWAPPCLYHFACSSLVLSPLALCSHFLTVLLDLAFHCIQSPLIFLVVSITDCIFFLKSS